MAITLFDQQLFTGLLQGAAQSTRRRTNKNLHANLNDPVQRLFITLMPDSYVRPHRHSQLEKWECFVMIQGQLSFLIFDQNGKLTARHELSAQGPLRGLEIPPDTWHAVVPGEEPAIFFEVKQGPYQVTTDKDFADWAPAEGETAVPAFLARLKGLNTGEQAHG
ncbi:WbuC family cupin fold metalloprotein [Bowmanella dokdonensis]|uniref:WbuC family cupin fold metalloprotein n=1 Tax=Bowmanella dokdonensis TaxID=751969 RepID=A0A939DQE3_9ALTE|nr:WbuC family cupin fold metalloprotein [Bowmanella dokdonensis]MBN7827059.1 WbuC family cupin fold metalloprotein [Bowmanella dokdonensis]